MKKRFIYCLIFMFLFIICGCSISNETLQFDFEVNSISVYKESDFEYKTKYEKYEVSSGDINDFLNELSNIKYIKQTNVGDVLEYYNYIIQINETYLILVIDDYFYISNNGEYQLCDIVSSDFSFLDEIDFKLEVKNNNEFYNSIDLETIILENVNNNIIVDVTSNKNIKEILCNAKYYINDLETEDLKLQYILHLSNEKGICVYEQGVIGFFNTESIYDKVYKVLNNEFDILNNIVDSNIKTFNFENIEKIVVGSTEIKDINGFLNKINNLEYVQILDDSYEFHYMWGIIIDDISIGVCKNNIFIVSKENNESEVEIYALNNCTFDFLEDLD